ncbi:MAG: sensor histidine kinase [Chitinophagaceae bacterium]
MNKALENKIILYSVLIVSALVSLPKLALLSESSLVRQLMRFDTLEFIFQWVLTALFCAAVFYMNLSVFPRGNHSLHHRFQVYWWQNTSLFLIGCFICVQAQRALFAPQISINFTRGGWFIRLGVCMLLEMLIIHIIYRLRETSRHEAEKEELSRRSAEAELELMKQQLNPHFFFNSLSALSGLTREDPAKAQAYIAHLSRIFRNLLRRREQMVTLREELHHLSSYTELLKMRLEDGLVLHINILPEHLDKKIPHFSLQPLVENAAKHNQSLPGGSPLEISIRSQQEYLLVENTLQPVKTPVTGTGLGLHNLTERFRMLVGKTPEISKNTRHFTVKLPLL